MKLLGKDLIKMNREYRIICTKFGVDAGSRFCNNCEYYGIDSIYDNSFDGCKILIDHSLPFGGVKIR